MQDILSKITIDYRGTMFNLYKQYQTTLILLMVTMFVSACGEQSEAPPVMQALPVSVLEGSCKECGRQLEAGKELCSEAGRRCLSKRKRHNIDV